MLIMFAALVAQQPVTPIERDRPDKAATSPQVRRDHARGTATVAAVGTGQPIKGIVFKGVDAPFDVAKAAEAFLGRPIDKQTLAELVATLTDAYSKSAVALFTISIPEQNFRDDVVIVTLAEAGVDGVVVTGKGGFPRLSGVANRMVGQSPLGRARFERQLSLMRSIPGVTFDLGTENPDFDNNVTLVLAAKRKKVELASGISNRGPDLVGDLIVDGRVDLYSLVTDGDRLRFSGAATPDAKRYRSLGVAYDTPIGLSGLTASASAAAISTRAKGLDIRGRAKVASIALSYPIIRSFKRAMDVSISLDGVNSDNAAFGNVITSDRTRTLRAAAGYSAQSDRSTIQASLIFSKGLDILGARVNPLAAETSYGKLNVSLSYDRQLGSMFVARTRLVGQYSRDRLPGSELFAVGGDPVGRAFDTAFLSGDRGFGGLAEMAVRPIAKGRFAKSEIYTYVDGAYLRYHSRGPFPDQGFDLASAGIGGRAKWNDKIELGLEAGRVIDRPYPGYPKDWRLSFGYRISM